MYFTINETIRIIDNGEMEAIEYSGYISALKAGKYSHPLSDATMASIKEEYLNTRQ